MPAWLTGPLPSSCSAVTAAGREVLALAVYRDFKGGKYLVKMKPESKRTILLSWEISEGYF